MVTDPQPRRTVLKSAAGVAAATLGLATLSGSAAAHFPAGLDVDVIPGSERNPINPWSNGVTSVAVGRTDEFDPASNDVRYRFGAPETLEGGGGARVVRYHTADVDDDGAQELVLQFRTNETGLDHDDEVAELRWDRDENREHGLSGRDAITPVGGGRP